MKTVIIGGVAGGASAAARLRRLDEHAEIIILEKGEYISFANCGLPYYIGGEITEKSALTLQTPASFKARFNIDVRVLSEAVKIDTRNKQVVVRDLIAGKEYTESYDYLVLSPGASPIKPPIPGADLPGVFTLRNIPDTFRIKEFIETSAPKKALVVGGGYIGIEMAENLHKAGVEVCIAELASHLVASLDEDVACDLHNHLTDKGVKLYLKDGIKSIEKTENGLLAKLDKHELEVDMVLLSVGVRPETALIKDTGILMNRRGAILTDHYMRTSEPDVYAVGDAVEVKNFVTGDPGMIPLAGPANRQGRIAADNICGIESEYEGTQGSAILKAFDMTIASTGITETAAKAAGIDCGHVSLWSGSHASYYPGATNMALKLVFDNENGRVLGAQIAGRDGVDKRCDVIATAIRGNMTVFDLCELELCYAPPFSSAKDPVNMAGFAAENILTDKVKQIHWNEVPGLDPEKVTLLDVRTDKERSTGYVPGFIHIPLDSLRERIGELDPQKPVYVHCFSGLRSYIACRILCQRGFDCTNISGGFRLYSSIKKSESIING